MPLKNPGTASRSGTCSLSYHSLNSASTSGSTPVHTASNPVPVFRAIGSPPSPLTAAPANRTTSTTAFAIHAACGDRLTATLLQLTGTLLQSFDPTHTARANYAPTLLQARPRAARRLLRYLLPFPLGDRSKTTARPLFTLLPFPLGGCRFSRSWGPSEQKS